MGNVIGAVLSLVGRVEVNKVKKKDVDRNGNPLLAYTETGKIGSNSASNKAALNIDSSNVFDSTIDLTAGNAGGVTLGLSELSLSLSLNFDKWSGTIKLGTDNNGSIFGEVSNEASLSDKHSIGNYGKFGIGPLTILQVALIFVSQGDTTPAVSLESFLNQIMSSNAYAY